MFDERLGEVLVAAAGLIDFREEVLDMHRCRYPADVAAHKRADGVQCVSLPAARAARKVSKRSPTEGAEYVSGASWHVLDGLEVCWSLAFVDHGLRGWSKRKHDRRRWFSRKQRSVGFCSTVLN